MCQGYSIPKSFDLCLRLIFGGSDVDPIGLVSACSCNEAFPFSCFGIKIISGIEGAHSSLSSDVFEFLCSSFSLWLGILTEDGAWISLLRRSSGMLSLLHVYPLHLSPVINGTIYVNVKQTNKTNTWANHANFS